MTFSHFSQYDQYFIGVDAGQAVDPTAIAIVRRAGGFSDRPLFRLGIWNGCRWGRRILG
jgi:hypothetical protein